ncbi:MAG: ZIP family metal transporter, partial [Candidatus Hodarchaeales archaeon]
MISSEIPIIFYSTIAGIATLSGILLMEKKQDWAIKNSHFINSFAAGLILSVAFFHLAPEANELVEGDTAFLAIFLGFLAFYLLENIVVLHSGAELHYGYMEEEVTTHRHSYQTSVMAFSGLAFHSFVDGIIIGVGFEVNAEVGFLAALAVILHEVPEGISSFAIMREAMKLEKARALAIIVAIATPIGALVSLVFIGN